MGHGRGGRRRGGLFQRLCQPKELERAWLEVLGHYQKDKVPADLQAFERRREAELGRLSRELSSRSFLPEPACLL